MQDIELTVSVAGLTTANFKRPMAAIFLMHEGAFGCYGQTELLSMESSRSGDTVGAAEKQLKTFQTKLPVAAAQIAAKLDAMVVLYDIGEDGTIKPDDVAGSATVNAISFAEAACMGDNGIELKVTASNGENTDLRFILRGAYKKGEGAAGVDAAGTPTTEQKEVANESNTQKGSEAAHTAERKEAEAQAEGARRAARERAAAKRKADEEAADRLNAQLDAEETKAAKERAAQEAAAAAAKAKARTTARKKAEKEAAAKKKADEEATARKRLQDRAAKRQELEKNRAQLTGTANSSSIAANSVEQKAKAPSFDTISLSISVTKFLKPMNVMAGIFLNEGAGFAPIGQTEIAHDVTTAHFKAAFTLFPSQVTSNVEMLVVVYEMKEGSELRPEDVICSCRIKATSLLDDTCQSVAGFAVKGIDNDGNTIAGGDGNVCILIRSKLTGEHKLASSSTVKKSLADGENPKSVLQSLRVDDEDVAAVQKIANSVEADIVGLNTDKEDQRAPISKARSASVMVEENAASRIRQSVNENALRPGLAPGEGDLVVSLSILGLPKAMNAMAAVFADSGSGFVLVGQTEMVTMSETPEFSKKLTISAAYVTSDAEMLLVLYNISGVSSSIKADDVCGSAVVRASQLQGSAALSDDGLEVIILNDRQQNMSNSVMRSRFVIRASSPSKGATARNTSVTLGTDSDVTDSDHDESDTQGGMPGAATSSVDLSIGVANLPTSANAMAALYIMHNEVFKMVSKTEVVPNARTTTFSTPLTVSADDIDVGSPMMVVLFDVSASGEVGTEDVCGSAKLNTSQLRGGRKAFRRLEVDLVRKDGTNVNTGDSKAIVVLTWRNDDASSHVAFTNPVRMAPLFPKTKRKRQNMRGAPLGNTSAKKRRKKKKRQQHKAATAVMSAKARPVTSSAARHPKASSSSSNIPFSRSRPHGKKPVRLAEEERVEFERLVAEAAVSKRREAKLREHIRELQQQAQRDRIDHDRRIREARESVRAAVQAQAENLMESRVRTASADAQQSMAMMQLKHEEEIRNQRAMLSASYDQMWSERHERIARSAQDESEMLKEQLEIVRGEVERKNEVNRQISAEKDHLRNNLEQLKVKLLKLDGYGKAAQKAAWCKKRYKTLLRALVIKTFMGRVRSRKRMIELHKTVHRMVACFTTSPVLIAAAHNSASRRAELPMDGVYDRDDAKSDDTALPVLVNQTEIQLWLEQARDMDVSNFTAYTLDDIRQHIADGTDVFRLAVDKLGVKLRHERQVARSFLERNGAITTHAVKMEAENLKVFRKLDKLEEKHSKLVDQHKILQIKYFHVCKRIKKSNANKSGAGVAPDCSSTSPQGMSRRTLPIGPAPHMAALSSKLEHELAMMGKVSSGEDDSDCDDTRDLMLDSMRARSAPGGTRLPDVSGVQSKVTALTLSGGGERRVQGHRARTAAGSRGGPQPPQIIRPSNWGFAGSGMSSRSSTRIGTFHKRVALPPNRRIRALGSTLNESLMVDAYSDGGRNLHLRHRQGQARRHSKAREIF